jgi:HPr kinase/phosphorylase
MVEAAKSSVHASAVLLGAHAILIRGPAGCGKSRLVLAILQAAEQGRVAFARLIADDRALLTPAHGRLLVQPAPPLAGLLEIRGLGIRRLPFEPVGVVSHVVDLAVGDAKRLPEEQALEVVIHGVRLPHLPVVPAVDPLQLLLAQVATTMRLTAN